MRDRKPTSDSRLRIAICIVLAAVTAAVYWQALGFDFVNFDDTTYVTSNAHVKAGLSLDGIKWAFATSTGCNWHPLTWLSLMLDASLGGGEARTFHLTNVLLHVINTLLLFAILSAATGRIWRSGFVAALFALHPLHVESVAWVAERKDVLSTLFWMLTILAYVRCRGRARSVLVATLFALGLMSKPMLVTLPLVLIVLDYWPLRRCRVTGDRDRGAADSRHPAPDTRPLGSLVLEKAPLAVMSAVSCCVTLWAQGSGGAVGDLTSYPLTMRLANAAAACAAYLGKMLWPARLSAFYPHPADSLPVWQVVGSGLLLAVITTLAVRLRARRPYVLAGWLWYLITLLPVIGIVQVGSQAMADRYTYIPLIGIFIALTWGVAELSARPVLRMVVPAAGVAVVAALAALSWLQIGYWRNSVALFSHGIAITPNSPVPYHNLACAMEADGNIDAAIPLYRKASAMVPRNAVIRSKLGSALMARGRLKEALEHLDAAAQLKPRNPDYQGSLGMCLALMGQPSEALPCFEAAARLNPNSSVGRSNLGQCLVMLGRYEDAEREFLEALRLDPANRRARANYENCLRRKNPAGRRK